MQKYKIFFYEWDCTNGEYIDRDYYGETITALNENELLRVIERKLEKIVIDAEKRGWNCEFRSPTEIICYKAEYCREVGYDYSIA